MLSLMLTGLASVVWYAHAKIEIVYFQEDFDPAPNVRQKSKQLIVRASLSHYF